MSATKECIPAMIPQDFVKAFEEKMLYCVNSRYDQAPSTTSKSAGIPFSFKM